MSQSRVAASCVSCGVQGPSRRDAAKVGWVRKSGQLDASSGWLCPACAPAWLKEEQRRLAEEQERVGAFDQRLLMWLSALGRMPRVR